MGNLIIRKSLQSTNNKAPTIDCSIIKNSTDRKSLNCPVRDSIFLFKKTADIDAAQYDKARIGTRIVLYNVSCISMNSSSSSSIPLPIKRGESSVSLKFLI